MAWLFIVLFLVSIGIFLAGGGSPLRFFTFTPPQISPPQKTLEIQTLPSPEPEKPKEHISEKKAEIQISSSQARETNPAGEYIELRLSAVGKNPFKITGLILENRKGGKIAIPKGVVLPYLSQINVEEDVFLNPGEKAIVVTGQSPIGYSFQINQCVGYFDQFYKFVPSLEKNCPPAAAIPGGEALSDSCQEYLRTLQRCETPLTPPFTINNECREFLNQKANYSSCVQENKNKSGFYKNEWRIYLNRSEEFWQKYGEEIKLLDSEKNLINKTSYD